MSDAVSMFKNPPINAQSGGAYIASLENTYTKKPEENPLSNANLPGGIFTHPNARMS